jgi:serine phosphatase RsbU (regulator of sigma subunit)
MLQQEAQKSDTNDGMDIAFIIIDKENMELEYAGAHNPLVIIREDKLIVYKADKMPIGIFYKEKESFTNNVIDLQKNDVIYLYSDGYADQDSEETRRKFMSVNLRELLTKISNLPMHQQKSELEAEHIKWKGNRDQVDDILIFGLKI